MIYIEIYCEAGKRMKIFKEIEEMIGRNLTDSEKHIVLLAYTFGKNEKA